MEKRSELCPVCGAEMPVDPGYTTWCDKCGWNIDPQAPKVRKTLYDRIQDKIGIMLTDRFITVLKEEAAGRKKFFISRVLAFLVATVTYSICIFFIYTSIRNVLRIQPFFTVMLFLFGIVCLPRFDRIKRSTIVHGSFPELFGVVEKVSAALDSKIVDEILLYEDFNAFYTKAFVKDKFGLKNVLGIGLPLLGILEPMERIALLSHEMAHKVNGDFSRGFYIGTALKTLNTWYEFISPKSDNLDIGLTLLSRTIFFIPRIIVFILLTTLNLLVWREHQMAEYYADKLAAGVSGADAMVSMLRKINLANAFYAAVSRTLRYNYINDIFTEFRSSVKNIPQHELERLERLDKIRLSSINHTHPPTQYRIEYIKSLNLDSPSVVFDKEMSDKLDAELKSEYDRINKSFSNIKKGYSF
jgi:Zn-dependent protease with chaperone function